MNKGFSGRQSDGDRPVANTVSGNEQLSGLSSPRRILLIDDNPAVAGAMTIAFRVAGQELQTASGPEEALSALASARFDAILLDMNFSPGRSDGMEGLNLLARIMADDAAACVIVITAHSGLRIAVAAMQAGARDFVMKPWRNADLLSKIDSAIARGKPAVVSTVATPGVDHGPARLLGESPAMHRLRDLIRRVAPTPASVTITGPAGSGRTLVALAIHAASPNASEEVIRIDVRDDSAWSNLDGRQGTVILRHADRLEPVRQARLLDRLPGGLRCLATVDDVYCLEPALRHRIATIEIASPPLSQRENDVVLLARHFARMAAERFGRAPIALSHSAEAVISAIAWNDEVRGLALAIDRAILLAEGDMLDAGAFEAQYGTAPAVGNVAGANEAGFDLSDAEKAMIEAALREHRHNVTHAAAALGLSRSALYRRMARHGL